MIKKNKIIARVAIIAFLVGHALAPTLILSAEKKKNDVGDPARHFNYKNRRNGKIIVDGKPVLVGVPKDIDLGQNGSYVYYSIEREMYMQGSVQDDSGNWQDMQKVKFYYVALSTSPLWIKEPDPKGYETDTMVFSQKNEDSELRLNTKNALYGNDDEFVIKNLNRKIFFLGTDGGESIIGSKSSEPMLETEYMDKVIAPLKQTKFYYYNENTNKHYLEILDPNRSRLNYYHNADSNTYRKVEILGKSDNVRLMNNDYQEIKSSLNINVNPEVEKGGLIVTPEVEKKEKAEDDTTREKKEQDKKDKGKSDEELKDEERTKGIEYEKYKDGSIVRDKEGNPVVKKKDTDPNLFNFFIYDPETGKKQTQRMFNMFSLSVPSGNVVGDGAGELSYNPIISISEQTAISGINIAPVSGFDGSPNFWDSTRNIVSKLVKPFYYSIFMLYAWRRSRTLWGGD